jgi:hypothetical protein
MRYFAIGLLLFCVIGYSCKKESSSEMTVLEESNLTGEELAKIHCGSCHLFSEPRSLPKAIWLSGVLPKMALRYGRLHARTNESF